MLRLILSLALFRFLLRFLEFTVEVLEDFVRRLTTLLRRVIAVDAAADRAGHGVHLPSQVMAPAVFVVVTRFL